MAKQKIDDAASMIEKLLEFGGRLNTLV